MERALAGKVAWVTGASRGLGRAIAVRLAGEGARVLVTGRDPRALGETVGEIAFQGGKAVHLVADVRDPVAMERAARHAAEALGSLDVVVANAGLSATTPLVAGDLAQMTDVITTNLLGTLHTFRAATPLAPRGGRFVAIGSTLGGRGAAGMGAYAASKAGVEGLVRALAHELARLGLTVNAVCPGWVDGELADRRFEALGSEAGVPTVEARRAALAEVPLGRLVDPDEVARVVSFLAGPGGASITGQSLSICGGAR